MQEDQDPKEVLREEEGTGHEPLVQTRGRHGNGPLERSLETLGGADGVVLRHGVRVVQGFVEEGAVDEVLGVVVAGAEEGYLHVVGIRVADRGSVEVGREHLWLRYRLMLLETEAGVENRLLVGQLGGAEAGSCDTGDGLWDDAAPGHGDAANDRADGADGHGACLGSGKHGRDSRGAVRCRGRRCCRDGAVDAWAVVGGCARRKGAGCVFLPL